MTNVEELLLSSEGNGVTLTNGVIAGSSIGYFAVVDGAGNDTVDASGVTNNVAVAFFASSGNDTFKGGNGNDAFGSTRPTSRRPTPYRATRVSTIST